MKQKYHVNLSEAERNEINRHLRSKKGSMESKKRAKVLLALDESAGRIPENTRQIAAANGVSEERVRVYRKRYDTEGLKSMLVRKTRDTPPVAAKVTGDVEAYINCPPCQDTETGTDHDTLTTYHRTWLVRGRVEICDLTGANTTRP